MPCQGVYSIVSTPREYAALVADWSSFITVSGVDCVYDTPICRKYNVQGYPTLRFIGTNFSTLNLVLLHYNLMRNELSLKVCVFFYRKRWTCDDILSIPGPTTNTSDVGITYDGDRSKQDLVKWTISMVSLVTNLRSTSCAVKPLIVLFHCLFISF